MKNDIVFYENPFYTVRQNVPELVWNFYYMRLKEEIVDLKLDFNQSQSFRQTIDRYSKGGRRYTAIYKIHFMLKDAVLAVFPIDNDKFWFGNGEEIGVAAKEVATKMLADFEALFQSQKDKISKAA